jgi:TRAP transporter 4TM/12TM fusion protein
MTAGTLASSSGAPTSSFVRMAIRLLKIALVLYIPLAFTLLPPPSTFHLVIGYTGAVLVLHFLQAMLRPGILRRIWNGLNLLASLLPTLWFINAVDRLSMPLGQPPMLDYVMGFALLVAVTEASRQALDWVMPLLAALLLLYNVFGSSMPGVLYHPGIAFPRVILQMAGSLSGPYGDIPTIIIEVVAMFLVFGAVVQGAGIADFFSSLTTWISGRIKSGAGLTAVSVSSLFGAITGAPVANVGTTGSFTIPLMKRAGYTPEQAAAIEGVAATGSQIIPPILGTAAFLMAQFLNKPYSEIAAVSLFPALLFITCVLLTVHALGMQSNTHPVKFEAHERASWAKSYLLLPVFALIVALTIGFSPQYAAFVATLATFGLFVVDVGIRYWLRGELRSVKPLAKPMVDHIESAANAVIIVVIAGAIIGVVVTLLSMPLTIQRLSSAAIEMAGGSVVIIIIIVAFASILLGTGLPTVATYVLVVLLFAPTVIQLGVEPLAAHMFVFYLGVAADISPPVALAVLAACGIAQADFWKASWLAMKIGMSFFILPFLFIVHPSILHWPVTTAHWITYVGVTAAMLSVTAGLSAYFFGPVRPVMRGVFFAIALMGMWPGLGMWPQLGAIAAFLVCAFVVWRLAPRVRAEAAVPFRP